MISDKEIIQAFNISDNEGYKKLIDAYGNYVYTIITSKVNTLACEQDKEECIADIFIETVKECKSHNFTMDSLKAIITVIAKRRATDLFRKLYRKDIHNENIDDYSLELADYDTPENISENKSKKEKLWNEVFKLGKPDSDIIVLQFFYGKTAREIANLLKMTTASVNKRSLRAREKLKKFLIGAEVV